MGKLRIGWYCPYTLPPLKETKGIQAVQITWNNNRSSANGTLGVTKLCKKLTAVQENVRNASLDGIVMADCCTLSRSLYSFINENHPSLFIHEVYIPRRIDSSFVNKLQSEWDKLTASIHFLLEQKRMEPLEGSTVELIHEDNLYLSGGWCELPPSISEYLDSDANDLKEICIGLLMKVQCPRLIGPNIREDEQGTVPDGDCHIQSYRSARA